MNFQMMSNIFILCSCVWCIKLSRIKNSHRPQSKTTSYSGRQCYKLRFQLYSFCIYVNKTVRDEEKKIYVCICLCYMWEIRIKCINYFALSAQHKIKNKHKTYGKWLQLRKNDAHLYNLGIKIVISFFQWTFFFVSQILVYLCAKRAVIFNITLFIRFKWIRRIMKVICVCVWFLVREEYFHAKTIWLNST